MQIPRFFLTQDSLDFNEGERVEIAEPAIVNQVKNVLRLRAGKQIVLLNGRGLLYECTIESIEQRSIQCRVDRRAPSLGDPPVKVTIGLALIKGERFEWALQKLAEVGVHSIVPLITERTVVKVDTTAGDAKGANTKMTRWQAIVKEAAEQSERGTIPHIVPPKKLDDFMRSAAAGGRSDSIFICAERVRTVSLKDIFRDHICGKENYLATKGDDITLLVGPEGGFSETEIALAEKLGAKPVSLGPRILRAETAAVYAVAQIIWCLEN